MGSREEVKVGSGEKVRVGSRRRLGVGRRLGGGGEEVRWEWGGG